MSASLAESRAEISSMVGFPAMTAARSDCATSACKELSSADLLLLQLLDVAWTSIHWLDAMEL